MKGLGNGHFAQYSALRLLFMRVQVEWVYRHSPTETEGMKLFPRILTLRDTALLYICMCISQSLPGLE